ncbi:MAG: hypothetical protein AAF974_06855 [Cyanobacteria bacterium P01_E01_bin.34]
MNLFDDSPEIRQSWSVFNASTHNTLLGQLKDEFERHPRDASPQPAIGDRTVRAIRQPQPRKSGRFSYTVG